MSNPWDGDRAMMQRTLERLINYMKAPEPAVAPEKPKAKRAPKSQ